MDISFLREFNSAYEEKKIPFLEEMKIDYAKRKPLKGVRILHNLVNSYETLLKIEPLLFSEAELTLTAFDIFELPFHNEIDAVFKKSGIKYIKNYDDISGEFDIVMDCAARALQIKNITIKKGIVELTQSGSEIYKNTKLDIPIVSVDDSNLKNFECIYGTGEAFNRAIKEHTKQDISGKKFLVLGYGKIGHGVVKYLKEEGANISVAEVDPKKLELLKTQGITGFNIRSPEELKNLKNTINSFFAIVTCTGIPGVFEKTFSPDEIDKKVYLANMGAENEFGNSYHKERLLFEGNPLNFSLKHPTLMKYLDPIFYAHNLAAELIMNGEFKENRYYKFPVGIDNKIISTWKDFFKEDISEIYFDHF